jgi:hypothetical protein
MIGNLLQRFHHSHEATCRSGRLHTLLSLAGMIALSKSAGVFPSAVSRTFTQGASVSLNELDGRRHLR